jgi:hypothetical protein
MASRPEEWVVIEFPRNCFRGPIADEVARLVASGVVRVADLAVISKDVSGDVTWVDADALDPDLWNALVLPGDRLAGRIEPSDVWLVGARLAPDTSAIVLSWERLWQAPLTLAVAQAGGTILTADRIGGQRIGVATAVA